ncbi:hypothetical protein GOODEAATRI_001490 [Goodea atripinnis]|uniref:Uncharacterized protein n=1 Tax=Goodea atripinnis TaxID=208336 RepID=A0ABV0P0I9_9TELE
MAEIVQQRIEDRIPELEQLERVGLFTKKEVKSIIKRATALEYKLHRLIVNKEDFIAYIQDLLLIPSRVNMSFLQRSSVVNWLRLCTETLRKKSKLEILLSSGDAEEAATVALSATQRYSQSVSVWSLSLHTLMQLGNGDMARLFHDALTHVNPKVWRKGLILPGLRLRGLLSPVTAVAMEMKELYLDWSYSAGGYKKARKTFAR